MRESIRLKSKGKELFIYRLEWFVPRFRFVDEIRVEPTGRSVLDQLSSLDTAALRSTAFLETADADAIVHRRALSGGTVKIIAYGPDRIELETLTSGNAFLVIASTWNPYWVATVDGQQATLVRTNHTQYGLPLSPGQHKLILGYRPPYASIFQ